LSQRPVQNIGVFDAYLRLFGGLSLLALGAGRKFGRTGSIVAVLLGASKVAEGLTRYCPVYDLLDLTSVDGGLRWSEREHPGVSASKRGASRSVEKRDDTARGDGDKPEAGRGRMAEVPNPQTSAFQAREVQEPSGPRGQDGGDRGGEIGLASTPGEPGATEGFTRDDKPSSGAQGASGAVPRTFPWEQEQARKLTRRLGTRGWRPKSAVVRSASSPSGKEPDSP